MKFLFAFLFLFIGKFNMSAQSPLPVLQKGDQFSVETFANTNSLYQRGDQSLEIDTRIHTVKQYEVHETSDTGYTFIIKTEKLFDSVSAMGRESFYSSTVLDDSGSLAEKAIKQIISVSDTVYTDKKGTIVSSGRDTTSYFSDTIVAFEGLMPSYYPKGNTLIFFTDYNLPAASGKGYIWTDSSAINTKKTITTYTIDSVTENNILVEFSRKITDAYANTNTNGTDMIDKHSGMLLQRITENSTLEYEVLNEALFSIGRRSAIVENCSYIPVKE